MPSPKPLPNLPDLRADHQEFTLEHCSALLERTARFFKDLHGEDSRIDVDNIDSDSMRDYLLELLNQNELSHMYGSEFGQGLLIGLFLDKLVELQESEDE